MRAYDIGITLNCVFWVNEIVTTSDLWSGANKALQVIWSSNEDTHQSEKMHHKLRRHLKALRAARL
jgi:hypothetical protein